MLEENIQKILDNFMIDYYGVADISEYESEIVKYGGELVAKYPEIFFYIIF